MVNKVRCLIGQCVLFIVDGEWGAWSNWSMCSVTCGNGSLIRERTCDNPMPDNGGGDCPGNNSETMSCEMEQCPGIFIKLFIKPCL